VLVFCVSSFNIGQSALLKIDGKWSYPPTEDWCSGLVCGALTVLPCLDVSECRWDSSARYNPAMAICT
jgi:hypothetical protein